MSMTALKMSARRMIVPGLLAAFVASAALASRDTPGKKPKPTTPATPAPAAAPAAPAPAAEPAPAAAPIKVTPVMPAPATATPATPAGPPSKAEFPETTFDAGTVERGGDVRHEFVVKNIGTNPLTIDAKPGCGCTVTEFDKLVQPGQSGKVVATVHTANFKGPISKSITVTTNDPDHVTTVLMIKANITVAVDVQPSENVTFMGRYDELKPQELTITAADKSVFDITEATSTDPDYKVAIVAAPEDGSGAPKPRAGTIASGAARYKVTVTPPAKPKIGRVNANITVKTTHPKAPDLMLRIFGNVAGDITFTPQTVMFQAGEAATADQKTTKVVIDKPNGSALKIVSVKPDNAAISADVHEVEAGRKFEVTLTYNGPALTQALSAKAVVTTNDPLQPTFEIPIWGRPDMPRPAAAMPGASPLAAGAPQH